MLRPEHLARIEKRDFCLGRGVKNTLFIRLLTVAMETSQRQVFQSIVAALGGGLEVVNRKGDQLPMLVGMTVLTKKSGALPDLLAPERRDFTRQGCPLRIAIDCESDD